MHAAQCHPLPRRLIFLGRSPPSLPPMATCCSCLPQVLLGPAAWALAQRSSVLDAANLVAASIGTHRLRGITGRVEVFR